MLSLCWLAFKVTWIFLQVLWKINGNYLSFAYCQIKSHFFLIPFLIFLKQATARAVSASRRDSLYIIPQAFYLCQLFFHAFLKFFKNFFDNFFRALFALQLVYITTYFLLCQPTFLCFIQVFPFFLNFIPFDNISLIFCFMKLDFIRARVIQYIIYKKKRQKETICTYFALFLPFYPRCALPRFYPQARLAVCPIFWLSRAAQVCSLCWCYFAKAYKKRKNPRNLQQIPQTLRNRITRKKNKISPPPLRKNEKKGWHFTVIKCII